MSDAEGIPRPGRLVPAEEAEKWISRFTSKFRPPPRKNLNSKVPIPSNMPTACLLEGHYINPDFSDLFLSRSLAVFAFFEGGHELYSTSLGEMLRYLNAREPWESYDMCLFDESLEWCLGINHEDKITFVHE
jgi:hypothetical protein